MKDIIFGTGASATKNANELEKLVWCAFSNDVRKFDTAPSYCMEKELSLVVQKTAKKNEFGERGFLYTNQDRCMANDGWSNRNIC